MTETERPALHVKQALATCLQTLPDYRTITETDLVLLEDKGLAHDHIVIGTTGHLARIPKQSQMALSPLANLTYQTACFQRAAPSGATPRFIRRLAPEPDLPMGALIVEAIEGGPVSLPEHAPAIAFSLAALHRLALPPRKQRAPLFNAEQAFTEALAEISRQSLFLDHAVIAEDSRTAILDEVAMARRDLALFEASALLPPLTLISFDAHPGNFILRPDGRAILVDLEKCRYSCPALDLAHATLYTSTSWDKEAQGDLSHSDMADFYECWQQNIPGSLLEAMRPFYLPMRRLMWLWSVTWCAKWQVKQRENTDPHSSTENWSATLSEEALIRHVADRTNHYLHPETIHKIRQDWRGSNALTDLLNP